MTDKIDQMIERGRFAHELSERHGINAHRYARTMAEKAANNGDEEAVVFWRDIEASLKPRQISN